jgi:hypothetical protein
LREPGLGLRQHVAVELAMAHAPHLLGADEPAGLEQLHVLHDGRERHHQRLGQLAHRRVATRQPVDDGAAGGIGQCLEDAIERLMLKHVL